MSSVEDVQMVMVRLGRNLWQDKCFRRYINVLVTELLCFKCNSPQIVRGADCLSEARERFLLS